MIRDAIISDCGRYRFRLTRRWSIEAKAVFVMLNPSTADANIDDPTIRRCIGFARSWGCGGIEVVNLFPWRATRPKDLIAAQKRGEDIRRLDERNGHIADVMLMGSPLVAAWGALPIAVGEVNGLPWVSRPLECLGVTKKGAPRHPLYLSANTALRPWSER